MKRLVKFLVCLLAAKKVFLLRKLIVFKPATVEISKRATVSGNWVEFNRQHSIKRV